MRPKTSATQARPTTPRRHRCEAARADPISITSGTCSRGGGPPVTAWTSNSAARSSSTPAMGTNIERTDPPKAVGNGLLDPPGFEDAAAAAAAGWLAPQTVGECGGAECGAPWDPQDARCGNGPGVGGDRRSQVHETAGTSTTATPSGTMRAFSWTFASWTIRLVARVPGGRAGYRSLAATC